MVRSIFMNRSILMSIAVIGAAITLVAGGGAFSPFTGGDSDTGTVTAGDADININGTAGNTGEVNFTTGANCPGPLVPGNTCTATVTVNNTGTLDLTLSAPVVDVTAISGNEGSCILTNFVATTTGVYTPSNVVVASTGSATVPVSVELIPGAEQGCQGATATVSVSVTGTSA